ncbi:lower collar protein [Bacillus phage TBA3]|uniref:Lower collar protein n=1 Tax=Bacillus phage BSTP4 TaxID=2801529 RepID=A0A7T8IVY3_9CAUD|nr:putative lower collar protein [Bacillus phage BSP4]AYJ76491.1 putative lower collar protein [Bacillus phage BSP2]QQO90049.1 lower collar protein [Bacillus phage BSTP4]UKM96365.1 lower collar protein [Bacillus phage TBA3]
MSSYTMQLRTYIEMWSQGETGLSTAEKIEKGRPKLFDFNYPIFDESYRTIFETHFIRNFYMREIGFETEGLFKFHLETWLMINMPYFNKLFESELIKYDPLENTRVGVKSNTKNDTDRNDNRDVKQDLTSNGTSSTDAKQNDTSKTTGNEKSSGSGSITDDNFKRDLNADTADDRLQLTTKDGEGVLEYASQIEEHNENKKRDTKTNNTTDTTSNTTGTSTLDSDSKTSNKANTTSNDKLNSQINSVEDYIEDRVGKIGTQSYARLVMDYREALLRIEQRIFNEMQELFMLVY